MVDNVAETTEVCVGSRNGIDKGHNAEVAVAIYFPSTSVMKAGRSTRAGAGANRTKAARPVLSCC